MANGRKIKVLVLEDDENLLAILGQQLDRLGFSVDLSLKRSPAAEMARIQGYDIVVSDINMPGLSLAESLDAIWKERPGLPVLLMTSGADPELIAEARAKGALGPIVKPFRAADLASRIRDAVQADNRKSSHPRAKARGLGLSACSARRNDAPTHCRMPNDACATPTTLATLRAAIHPQA